MEGVQSTFHKISKTPKFVGSSSSSSSSFDSSPTPLPTPPPLSPSSSMSGVLVNRPSRQWVSVWTCSKLCAVCFVAGVFVGYTLKRRVRRWLSNLLRRLKDD